jgi:UDP-glucuronate 4-epimerase
MKENTRILVTGAAGFIGYHLSSQLLAQGMQVIGLDNLNNYYDTSLKHARLNQLKGNTYFTFHHVDLMNTEDVLEVFKTTTPEFVVHLAAQAGVRYSLENPHAYIESNVQGFLNILEGCRHYPVKHLIFASSSSVYGANTKMPFSTTDSVDHPVSLYAATKKSNELMAHTYAHLYQIPVTGLRFFTVYGPYGRPDMAYFLFTKAILKGEPIKIFNDGKMKRDFTYIDDIVEGIVRLIPRAPASNPNWDRSKPSPSSSFAPYRIFNIGNNQPVELLTFIQVLEKALGQEAKKEFLPMQDGDVEATFADVDDLMREVDFKPATSIETGLTKFVEWYKQYYKNEQ